MSKKLLIVAGPQGSGNHIFSRLFSMHPDVHGWEELKNNFWVKHDREPGIEFFMFPNLITPEFFKDGEYFVLSVSAPFNYDSTRYNPKISEVVNRVTEMGIDVQVLIITRDEKINALQHQRLNRNSLNVAKQLFINEILNSNIKFHFVSLETFFFYKEHYLKYLETLLDFPIGHNHPDILKFITESPNDKYVKYVEKYWLDGKNSSQPSLEELAETQTMKVKNKS